MAVGVTSFMDAAPHPVRLVLVTSLPYWRGLGQRAGRRKRAAAYAASGLGDRTVASKEGFKTQSAEDH
jgi:hypothetical protein